MPGVPHRGSIQMQLQEHFLNSGSTVETTRIIVRRLGSYPAFADSRVLRTGECGISLTYQPPLLLSLFQSRDHDARGEHLREQVGLALARGVECVGRNPAAAEFAQGISDGFVVTGPIGAQ